jgi:hypothetical protein
MVRFDFAGMLCYITSASKRKYRHLVIDSYELIDRMEDVEKIIFADEYGTWMILADEKVFIRACLHSFSTVSTLEEFAEGAIPLLKRDSYESLRNEVYKTAVEITNKEQKNALELAIKKQTIRVK